MNIKKRRISIISSLINFVILLSFSISLVNAHDVVINGIPLNSVSISQSYSRETGWSTEFCNLVQGKLEVIVEGGRIDCLSQHYAWEVDKARNWKEGIAQAAWYGVKTDKIPGLALIVKSQSDYKYLLYVDQWLRKNRMFIKVVILISNSNV